MTRNWTIIAMLLVIASTVGCNRRCNSPLLPRPFASNARIPAPGTGNLQIPSRMASGGQPYYVPGSPGGTLSQAINPNQAAPTLATNPQDLNGWSRVAPMMANNPQNVGIGQAPNYNQLPTSFTANNNTLPGNTLPGYRVATSTTLNTNQGSNGANFNSNPQGQPQQQAPLPGGNDPSRIPASDASGSRAPSQLVTNAQFQAPQYQTPFQQQRYAADINVYQPIPPNSNQGLPQPPIRYQAELMASQPSPYQSPYARTANVDPYQQGSASRTTAPVGWNPR